jgi:hypothetical protein
MNVKRVETHDSDLIFEKMNANLAKHRSEIGLYFNILSTDINMATKNAMFSFPVQIGVT